MGGMPILKLVCLLLIVLLAITSFVCTFILKRQKTLDFRKKEVRVLMRIRVGCFLGMLICLLLIVVVNNN